MRSNRKSYLVVGLGAFGASIARTLCQLGAQVLAIDKDMAKVEEVRDAVTQAARVNAADDDAMSSLGLEDFDTAYVTMSSDIKASCVAVLLLKEKGVKHVVAKAQDDFHARMLRKLGADKIVFPERDAGKRMAQNAVSGHLLEHIDLSNDYSILEIHAHRKWYGKSLRELDLRGRLSINVIAVRSGEKFDAMPGPDLVISEGDVLLVVASEENIPKLERYVSGV